MEGHGTMCRPEGVDGIVSGLFVRAETRMISMPRAHLHFTASLDELSAVTDAVAN